MSVFEIVAAVGIAVLALSSAIIALQLMRISSQLDAVAGGTRILFPILIDYLTQLCSGDPPPQHHFNAYDPPDMVVWEWRDGQWVLRGESAAPTPAALPPGRPGAFVGECVTTPPVEAFA